MAVNTDRIQYLFRQYTQKTCTREELQELFTLIALPENRAFLEQLMDAEYEVLQPLAEAQEMDWEYIFKQVTQTKDDNVYPLGNRTRFRWVRVAAAAVIVLALGLGGYWFINRLSGDKIAKNGQPVQQGNQDVQPGGNKAVLTLADGTAITLDSAQNGLLSRQGNVQVVKNRQGELMYSPTPNEEVAKSNDVSWNSLATPRGGQYQLVLPDGSKVWLNAASSIRYPVVFSGQERRVELTGEAYFEVEKDPGKPFHVKTPTQDIEVLGTHFNVNAYNDEPAIATTLLEGRVKVVNGTQDTVVLKPGEQAVQVANSPLTIHHSPDLDQVIAWKNGLTAFKSADIKSIMRQVARWYNVDVVYEGDIPQRSFTGGISRNAPLSELLHLLEVSKVHFRIEGKRLIVLP